MFLRYKNLNKKIYIREDEVLKQIEEVFKRIGIRKGLRNTKRDPVLRFPFDIFEKTTTCTKVAGRSGQFQNHDRHKITDYSNAYSLLLKLCNLIL